MTETRFVPVGSQVVKVLYEEYFDPFGQRSYRKVPGTEEVVDECSDEAEAFDLSLQYMLETVPV